MGIIGPGTALVAIKTLKPGANQKTRNDFQREADLMTDLRHPNIGNVKQSNSEISR